MITTSRITQSDIPTPDALEKMLQEAEKPSSYLDACFALITGTHELVKLAVIKNDDSRTIANFRAIDSGGPLLSACPNVTSNLQTIMDFAEKHLTFDMLNITREQSVYSASIAWDVDNTPIISGSYSRAGAALALTTACLFCFNQQQPTSRERNNA